MGDSDYEFTDEQQRAALLMQQYQPLEDDEWDPNAGIFGEMDYSTFVSQRLREVNAQWDKEPLPDDGRQKFIEFKQDEELTSVYQPPPYPSENSENETDTEIENTNNSSSDKNPPHIAAESGKQAPTQEDDQGGLSASLDKNLTVTDKENPSTLPGEPLKSQQIKVSRKKKSLKFADDPSDSAGSVGSNNSDDLESNQNNDDQHKNKNENNNNNYSSSADDDDTSGPSQSSSTGSKPQQEEDSREDLPTTHQNQPQSLSNQKKEDRVLVEINGKFELVSVKELQAMGYPIPDELASENSSVSESSSPYTHHQRASRPGTSIGPRGGRSASSSTSYSSDRQRAHSANASPSSGGNRVSSRWVDWNTSGYRSPYALTPEQKELKERRDKIIHEREKAEKERKQEEDKRKREEADSAFEWWLQTKRDDDERKRHDSNQQDDGEKKEDNEAAFNAWCDAKREQQKKERLLKSREQKERDDAYFIRSRDECEAAFKRWLKNKRKEQRILYGMSASKLKSRRKKQKSNTLRPVSSAPRAEWSTTR